MPQVTLSRDASFSLSAAAGFGFGPNPGGPQPDAATMRLAFVTDDLEHAAGAALTQDDTGVVSAEIDSDADVDQVAQQLLRILSLDHPGEEWLAVGHRDPVIGSLQAAHPGLRPVLFHSPYEAAAWSVISARRHRSQAQTVRRELAEALGTTFTLGTQRLAAFPAPAQILTADALPGIDAQRTERLRAIATAAIDGALAPEHLLALTPEAALAHLQELPGIGPFYASLILLRATGATDVLIPEPRSRSHAAHFYGPDDTPLSDAAFATITDGWRPFRTWCMVLLRVAGQRAGLPR